MADPPGYTTRRSTGRLVTDPLPLAAPEGAAGTSLGRLAGLSVHSVRDLRPPEVRDLFRVAASLQSGRWERSGALAGLVVVTAFFEASTRTRLSFESAAHRLGAAVISIPDARVSSVVKGESLADTGVMLNGYADLVVMRHPEEGSLRQLASGELDLPLVNAGNGADEHPTQAVADWYTLAKWRPALLSDAPPEDERITLAVLGTPARMRAVRSFLLMGLLHFPRALRSVTVVSESARPLDDALLAAADESGVPVECVNGAPPLHRFDVLYQNSLTLHGDGYQVLDGTVRLDADSALKDCAVVMHPLARLDELSEDLDRTTHNLYFDQARGAVFARQALLLALTGRVSGAPGRHREGS